MLNVFTSRGGTEEKQTEGLPEKEARLFLRAGSSEQPGVKCSKRWTAGCSRRGYSETLTHVRYFRGTCSGVLLPHQEHVDVFDSHWRGSSKVGYALVSGQFGNRG